MKANIKEDKELHSPALKAMAKEELERPNTILGSDKGSGLF